MSFRIALLFTLSLSFAIDADAAPTDQAVQKADAMIKELGASLKGSLVNAMKSGGPTAAIPVCKEIGQAVAEDVSQKHGALIHRVSLKTRNSANTPNSLEAHLLGRMEEDNANNGLKPSYQATYVRGGQTYFLYMKPIVTGKVCLNCHGPAKSLAPAVKEALATSYPHDRAIGYAEGEVRGAFSVSVPR